MDINVIILFAAILVVGGILFAIISFTKRDTQSIDVNKYRSKWLTIEQQLRKDEQSSYQLTVLNADKLLDQALKDRRLKGETMGERMKNAQQRWTNANAVWSAHKLRNQIAHESDVHVQYDEARRALAGFKQALKDLGTI